MTIETAVLIETLTLLGADVAGLVVIFFDCNAAAAAIAAKRNTFFCLERQKQKRIYLVY